MEKEILEFLTYRIRNNNITNGIFKIIIEVFNLMISDGMTYYTNERYKNIIGCEMNVFSNMLEIIHLWENNYIKLNNKIKDYLYSNRTWGLNLSRVDLKGTHLLRANLGGANLEGANLEGANLINVNLINANLKGANLGEAVLDGAELENVDLTRTTLIGVVLDESQVAYLKINYDLSNTQVHIKGKKNIVSYEEYCKKK